MKISKNWRRMQQVYLYFAEGRFDLSEAAAEAMYLYESKGQGNLGLGLFAGEINGYAVAKHWLNVTVSMWKTDLQAGLLYKHELYGEVPEEFHWWLDSVLKNIDPGKGKRS